MGFFLGACAALLGGTFHGFALYQSPALHKGLWDAAMLLIGASAAFMVSAALAGPLKREHGNTRWLRAGLWTSLLGIAIQLSGISIHPEFNHNDLFHCVQTVGLYFLFRGARLTI
jgi:hypothetical protein